jgi:glycosyltransferase involved in cell wall biosynthesis
MKEKIKLFVDAHVFDGIPQGTVTYLAGLYSELIKDSRFQLYIGSSESTLAESFLGSDNFIHIKYDAQSRLKRLIYTIPKTLKENKIDFAHFQYISPIKKPCKYIVTIHDLLFLEFPENFPLSYRIKNSILFYLSAKRADLVTTVSGYSKKSINHFFKIPINKIAITPNAVIENMATSEPIKQLQNKKFILFVSRIEPRKNQALLIEVWKELNLCDQNIDLVLVGSVGIEDNQFREQMLELTTKEQQHFYWLTKIPRQNLIWLYQNCSLFVFPSIAEGFGIPPLEAAIYGAKVLCSNKTAMSEFTFFNDSLFSPDDKIEFKTKLMNSLRKDLPQPIIKQEILNRYNWSTISNNFSELIIEIFNEKK